MTPLAHVPPGDADDSPGNVNPGRTTESGRAAPPAKSSHDDDLFYFVDKAAGVALLSGIGYLLLRHAPGGFWIAVALTVLGGTIKLLFRVL
jgi:hypothetical protein